MSNLREMRITVDGVYQLLGGSPTGNETLMVFGEFGGATVEIQTELVLRDGTTSQIITLPEDGTYTENFSKAIFIGKGSNMYLNVIGGTASDIVAKAFVLN